MKYFVPFDRSYYAEFQAQAQKLFDDSKPKSFHGKEFKRKNKDYYKKFLELIGNILRRVRALLHVPLYWMKAGNEGLRAL